jgi:hypothetical protein
MPAQGFFIRHVKGIVMRDVTIKPIQEDLRPAFVLEDVDGADFTHIKAPRTPEGSFALKNVKDFSVTQSRTVPDTYLEAVTRKAL